MFDHPYRPGFVKIRFDGAVSWSRTLLDVLVDAGGSLADNSALKVPFTQAGSNAVAFIVDAMLAEGIAVGGYLVMDFSHLTVSCELLVKKRLKTLAVSFARNQNPVSVAVGRLEEVFGPDCGFEKDLDAALERDLHIAKVHELETMISHLTQALGSVRKYDLETDLLKNSAIVRQIEVLVLRAKEQIHLSNHFLDGKR